MPQILKDEVRERILGAALEVFARDGYEGAKVAEIARRAGISAGNVYRYFADRENLFYTVLTPGFVRRLRSLVRRRVESLDGVRDVRRLGTEAPFHRAAEELLAFSLRHRLEVVVLLGHCRGSRYEGFAERLVADLTGFAVEHFRGLDPELRVTAEMRFNLSQIYRAFVRALVTILESSADEAKIRRLVAGYTRYHLAGLNGFFEEWPEEPVRQPPPRRRP